ncbi:MAG: hypothetical protein ACYC1F_10420 [Gallionellaceae bacterium]
MTPIAAIEVPEVFARCHNQADFYRRGWRDAQAGQQPATMRGYPAALALAYAAGGMDAMAEAA